jgi:YD repeat-containing protein
LAEQLDGSFKYTSPDQSVQLFDRSGRLLSTTDRYGLAIQYDYDTHGRLSRTVDPDGRVATFVYDSAGYLSRLEQVGDRVTTFVMDSASGDLARIIMPDGGVRTYAYDGMGRLESAAYGPSLTTLSYDTRGFLRTIDQGGGVVTTVTAALASAFNATPLRLTFALASVTEAVTAGRRFGSWSVRRISEDSQRPSLFKTPLAIRLSSRIPITR